MKPNRLRFWGAHGCSGDTSHEYDCDGFSTDSGGVWIFQLIDGEQVPTEYVTGFSGCAVLRYNGKDLPR